jgi:TonB family protein
VRWRLIGTGVAVLVLLAVFAGLTIGYEMHNTGPQVLDATQTYQPAKPTGQEPAPEHHGPAKSKLRSGKSPATAVQHPFQVYGGEPTRGEPTRTEEAMTARPPEVPSSAAKAEERPPAAVSRRPAPRAEYAEPDGYGSIAPGTIGVSPAMMQGRLLFNPLPMYPQLARVAHIQGKVLVQALVGRDGRVHEADVVSGHRLLRAAAKRAVLERTYRPYTVNGHPVEVSTMVTVDFRLDDQD